MFNALVKKVFNPTNRINFYGSVVERKTGSSATLPLKPETKSKKTMSVEQKTNEAYYDLLFGKLNSEIKSDDLSLDVVEKVNDLLVEPEMLLNTLPVLPTSLSLLLEQMSNNDFDAECLVSLIKQEPAVAAKVVELANSSYYNRSSKVVTDLKSAFLMLGTQGLSEGVINSFIHRLVPQSTIYFLYYGKRIWGASLTTGCITKSLLEKSSTPELAGQGYLLGLISNLGEIIIYQLMTDAVNLVHPDCQPNSVLFRDILEQNAKKFSCTLTKFWNFPQILTDSLAIQTQLESSRQVNSHFATHPLACYLFEARLLTQLKMLLEYNQLSKVELQSETRELTLSNEARSVIEDILTEHAQLKSV